MSVAGVATLRGGARAAPVRGARAGPPRSRPTWVEVDLDAVTRNVATLRRRARGAEVLAAVKADGYGHGMVPVARAALAGGAGWLGVALIEEAGDLRAAGISAPALLFSEPPADTVGDLLAARVTPAVYTPEFVTALDRHVTRTGTGPVAVHVKIDTGMRRVGAPEHDWEALFRLLADAPGIRVQGLMSHLAVADDPDDDFTDRQAETFRRGVAAARAAGLDPPLVHLANSAATLSRPGDHHTMVRPGIAVYGLDPGAGMAGAAGLRPALSWWTRVALVKRVPAGEAAGYGLTWTAPRDTTLLTLPVGYGDGLRRAASNRAEVVVAGRRAPVVGRVSMDQTLVAVDDDADGPVDVAVGDEVAIIGEQDGVAVTADDWASWLGTITYEITTAIGPRVPRVHLGTAQGGDA